MTRTVFILLGLFSFYLSTAQNYKYVHVKAVNSGNKGLARVHVSHVDEKWEAITDSTGIVRYPAEYDLIQLMFHKEGWVIHDESVFFQQSTSEIVEVYLYNFEERRDFRVALDIDFKDLIQRSIQPKVDSLESLGLYTEEIGEWYHYADRAYLYFTFLSYYGNLNWDQISNNLQSALNNLRIGELSESKKELINFRVDDKTETSIQKQLLEAHEWLEVNSNEKLTTDYHTIFKITPKTLDSGVLEYYNFKKKYANLGLNLLRGEGKEIKKQNKKLLSLFEIELDSMRKRNNSLLLGYSVSNCARYFGWLVPGISVQIVPL